MYSFHECFENRHVVLPVIHVSSREQAIHNASVARDAGADGVFLIDHDMRTEVLLEIHQSVRTALPDWWVGVNCLGLTPQLIFRTIPNDISGVWVDNAMIQEEDNRQEAAREVLEIQRHQNWQGLYFGGVAFKYQRPVEDLAAAAVIATRYMDVVTTSGPGTGQAASPEKIRIMKQAIGNHPLAIASGITPENVGNYLDTADCFLVASGICRSFHYFEPRRVQMLVHRIRGNV